MTLPDIQQLLDSKILLSGISILVGALLGNFISVYRGRIKVLEYTVTHDRIGLSADDAIFGNVRVTWQGHNLTNLYSSVVTVVNGTSVDYTNLKLKVYTGNTLLLTERTEISGTTHVLHWTPEYAATLQIPAGGAPTDQQFNTYRHSREYHVPVLNRGQRAVMHILTTIPNQNESPLIWVDLLHPGAQIQFRLLTQQIHGVPVKLALPLGLLASIAVLIAVSFLLSEVWAAALIAMIVGLGAQSIGAWVYRGVRFVKQIVLRWRLDRHQAWWSVFGRGDDGSVKGVSSHSIHSKK